MATSFPIFSTPRQQTKTVSFPSLLLLITLHSHRQPLTIHSHLPPWIPFCRLPLSTPRISSTDSNDFSLKEISEQRIEPMHTGSDVYPILDQADGGESHQRIRRVTSDKYQISLQTIPVLKIEFRCQYMFFLFRRQVMSVHCLVEKLPI